MKLIVMPLDDFDLILGMKFFYVAMVHVMFYRKCIIIIRLETLCVVQCQFQVHGRSEPSL